MTNSKKEAERLTDNYKKTLMNSRRDEIGPKRKQKIIAALPGMYKAQQRAWRRLHDYRVGLHESVIDNLRKNYDHVVIGDMSAKQIASKRKGLPTETVRHLHTLANFEFKQRLKRRFEASYREIDESWTSKTCTVCGKVNGNLGSSKIFKCCDEDCAVEYDRDVGGARNILKKSIM